jgi:hypothetical protein
MSILLLLVVSRCRGHPSNADSDPRRDGNDDAMAFWVARDIRQFHPRRFKVQRSRKRGRWQESAKSGPAGKAIHWSSIVSRNCAPG